jgi:hypothetical protein
LASIVEGQRIVKLTAQRARPHGKCGRLIYTERIEQIGSALVHARGDLQTSARELRIAKEWFVTNWLECVKVTAALRTPKPEFGRDRMGEGQWRLKVKEDPPSKEMQVQLVGAKKMTF